MRAVGMGPKAAAKRKGQWMRRALFAIAATSMAMACGPGLAQVQPPSFTSSGNGDFDSWRKVTEAEVVYVAIDGAGKPTPIQK